MSLLMIFSTPAAPPAPSAALQLPLTGTVNLVYPWGVQARAEQPGVVDPNVRRTGVVGLV